jgi:cell division transport system permease protein
VKVNFKDSATTQQRNDYARMLQQSPYVKVGGITYVPKAQAYKDMARRYPEMVQNLTSNPFPNSLRVTPNKGENVNKLYTSLTGPDKPAFIGKITDGKKLSHRILQVAHVIEVVFTLATLVLVVASVLLISNTIRLSIFSRRREIEVMKLVGATNWVVRGPFMLEGLICGVGGALLAIIFLVLGKTVALPSILPHLSGDANVHAMAFPVVALILLGAGLGLGAVGSGLTIRRFLRV